MTLWSAVRVDRVAVANERMVTGPTQASTLTSDWSKLIDPSCPIRGLLPNITVLTVPGTRVVEIDGVTVARPPSVTPGTGATVRPTVGPEVVSPV